MPTPIESRSLQTVDRGRQLVTTVSHRLNGGRARGETAERERSRFETTNPAMTQTDHASAVHYGWLVATVAAAYIVDCVLAASVVDDLGARLFGDSGLLRGMLRFVFPLTLVVFEVAVGNARQKAQDTAYGLPSAKARGLLVIGLLIALVMPCLVVATQIALYLGEEDPDAAFNLMTAALTFGLGAASLALHLFLLFNGPETMEAKAYVLARMRHRSLVSRERKAQHEYRLLEERLEDTYARYDQALRDHNTQHPHLHRDPGPFAARTIRLVNEMLQRQEGGAGPAAAPSVGPIPPGPVSPPARHGEDEVTL